MMPTKTVYLFSSNSNKGHSLLKFDISLPQHDGDGDGDCNVSSPKLIHHFFDVGHDRTRAGCGLFDSKLFILGGISHGLTEIQFPLEVIVFDPATSSETSSVPNITYPKVDPIMFEADGKLFVLGSHYEHVHYASPGTKIFEKYDHETNKWKELSGPSIPISPYRFVASFVRDPNTIIVLGHCYTTLHVYNPNANVWCNYEFPVGKDLQPSIPSYFERYLYWAQWDGSFRK